MREKQGKRSARKRQDQGKDTDTYTKTMEVGLCGVHFEPMERKKKKYGKEKICFFLVHFPFLLFRAEWFGLRG
jgi:hypothetical protein